MALPPIKELLDRGTDQDKIMRIENLYTSEVRGAIQDAKDNHDSKKAIEALQMLVDVCLLAQSLSTTALRRKYNPATYAVETLNTFHELLRDHPKLVAENQEKAFPLLVALGMVVPKEFAYEAAWHIIAEMDVVRDPHQIASIGNRHLPFFVQGLEPFLFKEMFDARDRGDTKSYENLGHLWNVNIHHMFLIHRSTAMSIVRRRYKHEIGKQTPDEDKRTLLTRAAALLGVRNMPGLPATDPANPDGIIDALERQRRARLAKDDGKDDSADKVDNVFAAAKEEFAALDRPDSSRHFTVGTSQADALKRPGQALKFLNKFMPPEGSQPH